MNELNRQQLSALDTPCLVLDRAIMLRNIDRMVEKAQDFGVGLRVHIKTSKSVEVAGLVQERGGLGLTVSTVKEAEYFFERGFDDITYGVSIVPDKLKRFAALVQAGAKIKLMVDSVAMARAVVDYAEHHDVRFDLLIEVDTDGHRMGVEPKNPALLEIAQCFADSGHVNLCGILAHAGESYACKTLDEIRQHAEQERRLSVEAAEVLRAKGLACPVVSIGSTPTSVCTTNLEGVTEIRPGNFVFFDLFQAGLEVCSTDDIAVRVLTTVIGHDKPRNRLFVDAGGMALSKDLGTSGQTVDQRFGLVRESIGEPDEMIVVDASQEHGTVSTRGGSQLDFARFPIGSRLSILPVHSCMTSAAHCSYQVVDGDDEIVAAWDRCSGW